MDYTGRLAGSPLVPMDLIAKSLLAVFLLMVLVHVAVNYLRRDLPAKRGEE